MSKDPVRDEKKRKRPRIEGNVECDVVISDSCDNGSLRILCAEWGFDELLTENLLKMGITSFFPSQIRLFSTVFGNRVPGFRYRRDICFSSPTGSGKTLAFALPVLNSLIKFRSRQIRAIIVEPNRSLVDQVHRVIQKLVDGSRLQVEILSENAQVSSDIIICTPDSLSDCLETSAISFSKLEFLVIDEADRLLDHDPKVWLKPLLRTSRPQKLIFSASMAIDSDRLHAVQIVSPLKLNVDFDGHDKVSVCTLSPTLHEYILPCSSEDRLVYLLALLTSADVVNGCTVVFASSLQSSSEITQFLHQCNIQASEYSRAINRSSKLQLLQDASNGLVNVIVASDGACRGLDIPSLSMVVNYDLPSSGLNYLHRIGRTARGGQLGRSVTLVRDEEMDTFRDIRKEIEDGVVNVDVFEFQQQEEEEEVLKKAREMVSSLLN